MYYYAFDITRHSLQVSESALHRHHIQVMKIEMEIKYLVRQCAHAMRELIKMAWEYLPSVMYSTLREAFLFRGFWVVLFAIFRQT